MAKFRCRACGKEGTFVYDPERYTCPLCDSIDVSLRSASRNCRTMPPLWRRWSAWPSKTARRTMIDEVLLWILSDLHLELTRGWDLPSGDARPRFHILVVAGDLITRMERGVAWLRERVPDLPVIYVPGNHEGYGCDVDRTVEKAKQAAEGSKVFVLENEAIRLGLVTSPSRARPYGRTSICSATSAAQWRWRPTR